MIGAQPAYAPCAVYPPRAARANDDADNSESDDDHDTLVLLVMTKRIAPRVFNARRVGLELVPCVKRAYQCSP